MKPLALAALAVMIALPSRAGEAIPRGGGEFARGGLMYGWTFDGNLAVSLPEAERLPMIDEFSAWVVRQRFANQKEFTPDLAHQAAGIASFLKDTLDPSLPGMTYQVIVDHRRWDVMINRVSPAGRVLKMVGRFEPTLSGLGDGKTPSFPGLSVYGRTISASGEGPAAFYEQHVGDTFLERVLPASGMSGSALAGYEVTRTDSIFRCPRGADRALPAKLEGCAKFLKEKTTVFSSPGIAGETINELARIYAPLLPKPFPVKHCDGADLGDRFPTPPTRDQGGLGSCHIFASVALLENALRRSYGLDLPLSEQDLFNGIQNIQNAAVDASPGLYYALKLVKGSPDLGEGGLTNLDLAYAKLAGVATRKTIPYTESKPAGPRDPVERAAIGVEEIIKRLPSVGAAPAAAPGPVAGKAVPGPGQTERDVIKKALAPFTLGHALFTPMDAGLTQREFITRELCRGRPVAVGMNVKGLAGFDGEKGGFLYNATHPAGHAFLLTGFEEKTIGGAKTLVFKTRNSWGGINPDITAAELWRMNSAAVIEAPKASAPAGLKELADAAR